MTMQTMAMCIAVGGYLALTGLLAPLRVAAGQVLADDATIPGLLTRLGFGKAVATWLTLTVAIAALCWFVFSHAPFRRDFPLLVGGVAAGFVAQKSGDLKMVWVADDGARIETIEKMTVS